MEPPLTAPCIFCGSDRPVEEESCPTCGRGWIDSPLPSPEPAPTPAEETPQPVPEPHPVSRADAAAAPEPSAGTAPAGEPTPEIATPQQLGFATGMTDETEAPEPAEGAGITEPIPVHTDAADTGWEDDQAPRDTPEPTPPPTEPPPNEMPPTPSLGSPFGDDVGDEWNPLVPWDAKEWTSSDEEGPEPAEPPTAAPPPDETPAPPPDETPAPPPDETPAPPPDETPATPPDEAAAGTAAPPVAATSEQWGFPDPGDLPEPDAAMLEPGPAAEPAPEAAPAAAGTARAAVAGPIGAKDAAPPSGGATGAGRRSRRDERTAAPPPSAPDAGQRSPRRIHTLAVAGAVAAVVIAWFVVLALITRGGEEADVVAGATATPAATSAPTTSPPGDATTTTATTVASATTSPPTVPPLTAEGEPVAIADLALGGFGLGPFDFGTTGALGRLVATFGQPDSVVSVTEEWGTCAGEEGIVVTWGPLDVIFRGTTDNAALLGYRVRADGDHPAAQLTTLSGFAPGGSVADLQAVYAGFAIAFDEVGGAESFILTRVTDGVTLLWGPVSSADPSGVVEGVYSPRPCDQGPVPTS